MTVPRILEKCEAELPAPFLHTSRQARRPPALKDKNHEKQLSTNHWRWDTGLKTLGQSRTEKWHS